MIIAAVDVSGSISTVPDYEGKVYRVLSSLTPPIRLIQWNTEVVLDITYNSIDKSICQFEGEKCTKPKCFFKLLPTKIPIELYIFTDGDIFQEDVDACLSILESTQIQLSHVYLHYIGDETQMNLRFTNVFEGSPQTIHINDKYIGTVKPNVFNFDDFDYYSIMEDDSFKATVLTLFNSPNVDKAELKHKVTSVYTRILKELSKETQLTISRYYAEGDVESCIRYVKVHSYYKAKVDFQRKFSDVLKLFNRNIDIHTLKCFTETPKFTFEYQSEDEEVEVEEQVTKKKGKATKKKGTANEKATKKGTAKEKATKKGTVNEATKTDTVEEEATNTVEEEATNTVEEEATNTVEEEADTVEEKADTVEEKEEPLECEYLTCDILYEKCKLACIPVKICNDDVWPDKQTLRNPFKLLESDSLIQRFIHQVEPFVMDYKTYLELKKNASKESNAPKETNIPKNFDLSSPFTRDALQGVYILHNDHIDVQAMIKHNNYILSTFFQNTLPGKPVLWHMIFLYILAMKRFQDKKAILFEEIRFLGTQATYFITLSPYLNPPIVEDLNCCFWYLAQVCPKAFPNSKRNVLRKVDFISGVFLKFYQNVYEENYTYPTEMPLWQLWYTLRSGEMAIFSILSHYYQHEEIKNGDSKFNILLYRVRKEANATPPKRLKFLSQFSLEEVLNIYKKCLEDPNPNANLKEIQKHNIRLYDETDDKDDDLLSHVKINLRTCHPYVMCPITKKSWKNCIGPYNRKKHSYVRLFPRYCEKYNKYPQSSDDLLCFLNERLYEYNRKMPEVFPVSIKQQMNQVMDIYKEVMEEFSYENFLLLRDRLHDEKDRKKLDVK